MVDRSNTMSGVCDCEHQQFDCPTTVQQYLEGTSAAGDRLVEKFEGLVRAKVVNALGGSRSQEFDDCCQFVWIRVFGQSSEGTRRLKHWLDRVDRGPFCHWLRVLAVHRAVDWIRQPLVPSGSPVDELDPAENTPSSMIDDETWLQLSRTIAESSPEIQELFRLWYIDELSWKEIALRLRICERTVFNWRNTLFDRLGLILSSSLD